MAKPRKEPILLHAKQESRLCLNCGFPNRDTDALCMYCGTSLAEEGGLIAWARQTYYVLRWRWQLRQRREQRRRGSGISFLKTLGYFTLGAVLSGAGLYIFINSVIENSFSNALISLLFLFYGVFTLKNLLSKK